MNMTKKEILSHYIRPAELHFCATFQHDAANAYELSTEMSLSAADRSFAQTKSAEFAAEARKMLFRIINANNHMN